MIRCKSCKKEIARKSDLVTVSYIPLLINPFHNQCYAKMEKEAFWRGLLSRAPVNSKSYKFRIAVSLLAGIIIFGVGLVSFAAAPASAAVLMIIAALVAVLPLLTRLKSNKIEEQLR